MSTKTTAVLDETPRLEEGKPNLLGELRELPLVSLHESPWNPRRYFSETALKDLTESIQGKGITTPLIVRPTKDGFEIGAGARRFRAAKAAGLNLVPCVVRKLDDQAFLELICFENGQREDPHFLDEAAGFRMYMQQTGANADEVGRKNGISRSQVYARLKVAEGLIPEVSQACWDGKITAGHAILIARLQPKEQEKALKYCTGNYSRPSVRQLQQWIEDDICLEMAKAPFDLSDAMLVPDELRGNRTIEGPGSCTACPKRSLNNPDLFPELQPGQVRADAYLEEGQKPDKHHLHDAKSADVCTDPGCFHRKLKAHIARQEAKAAEKHGDVLIKITTNWSDKKETVGRSRWTAAKKDDKDAKPAIVTDGEDAGKTVYVKVKPKPKDAPAHDFETERRERDEKIRREKIIRRKVFEAVLGKVTSIDRDDIIGLVQNALENSRGEGVEILAQCFGIPESALSKQVTKWHGRELAKAMVGALVASELGGWFEPENLLDAAKRYKVDAAKIRLEMEAEFKKQDQAQAQPEDSTKPADSKLAANKAARLKQLRANAAARFKKAKAKK